MVTSFPMIFAGCCWNTLIGTESTRNGQWFVEMATRIWTPSSEEKGPRQPQIHRYKSV